jgi:hypothetical protein
MALAVRVGRAAKVSWNASGDKPRRLSGRLQEGRVVTKIRINRMGKKECFNVCYTL